MSFVLHNSAIATRNALESSMNSYQAHIEQTIKSVRAELRNIAKRDPMMKTTGSFQYAERHIKDAAMLLKRGADDGAMTKVMQAKEILPRVQALATWA